MILRQAPTFVRQLTDYGGQAGFRRLILQIIGIRIRRLERLNILENMQTTFVCPHCKKQIELTEAFRHQYEEEVSQKLAEKHAKDIQEVTKQAEEKALGKVTRDFQLRLENITKEAQEEKSRNKELLDQLKTLTEEMRALRRKDEERDLEMKKKIAEDEEKIRDTATKQASEKFQREIAELKKQAEDTKKDLESANYKLSQTSQQLRGEVLELDVEKLLRESYPEDEIIQVKTGAQGADIIHRVKGKSGRVAGVILWETKRAKWSPSWLPKLREDARNQDATIAILVSTSLPKEIVDFKLTEGVIVCSDKYVLALAALMRRSVLQIAVAKQTAATKEENLERLRGYIQSETFRHRFEAFVEGIDEMKSDLDYEKRVMERVWKKREGQIKKVELNAARMYGELQGVMRNALPDIKSLSLPDGNEKE